MHFLIYFQMFFLLLVLFVYLLNITILFQGQSLILLVAFWILCILVKKAHTSMESTTFQVEVLEWVETMQFLVLLKAWYLFSIRLVNIKFYNFYKFVHLLRHELNEIMEEFFSILHKLYMRQIQWNALWNLERLLYKKNNLKIRSFDLRYLLNIQA